MNDNQIQKKANVPNLRFPEFSGEWERKTLGEVGKFSKGVGISKDQRSESGNPCILYGELYTHYKSEVISEVRSKTNLPEKGLVKSVANDIIIPASGETAEDIATARCVPFDNVFLGGDLNIIRLSQDDGRFISYQLNGVRKYDIAKVAQGVSVVHLHGDDLKGISINVPSILEQNKIAELLSIIDERIAIQNKIIEDLKKLKSAIIDTKILRNQVAVTIRLSEVCKEAEQIKESTPSFDRIITVRLHANGVHQSNADNLELGATQYYIRKSGQLIYGKQNFHNGAIGIIPESLDGGLTSKDIPSFDIFQDKVNPIYLVCYMQHPSFYKPIEALTTGSGSKRLKERDFLNLQIHLPNKEVQDEIAHSLMVLVSKIDLESRILDLYTKQRSYLLSQMFI